MRSWSHGSHAFLFLVMVLALFLASFPGTAFTLADDRPMPPHTEKVLHVTMVSAPPVIDGNMDDACWKNAALADDFSLFKGIGWPTQKTEVRVAYDTEHLYFFATMYESQPAKILTPTPDDHRDNAVHGDDCLEIFIDKQLEEQTYYHLTVNAANVRYDSGPGARSWNPTWKSATRIGKDAWYLEIAFPFRELIHPGAYAGTPPQGTEWRINFNRMERPSNEMSNWSTTYRGFHEPANFGHIIFEGHPTVQLPQFDSVSEGERFFGVNTLEAKISNRSDKPAEVTVKLSATVGGQPVGADEKTLTLPAGAEQMIPLKYELMKGGEVAISLEGTAKGQAQPFATGMLQFRLPALDEEIPAFAERLATAVAAAEKFDNKTPGVAELRTALQDQSTVIKAIQEEAGKGLALPSADWRALAERFTALVAENKAVDRQARALAIYTRLAADGTKPQYYLSTAGPLDLVFEKDLISEPLETVVNTRSAGHEYESFQIVVVPIFGEIKNITVWPGDLRTADGNHWINGKHISFRVIDSVHRPRPWYFKGDEWPEWFPDILWPKTLFDVKENTQKAVWITIYTPKDTPAGTYTGRIAIKPAESPAQYVTVNHQVWGFNLPDETHLRCDPWFSIRELQRFYNLDRPVPLEMEIAYKEFISNYRLSSLGLSWVTHLQQDKLIKSYVDKNGDFTYDFDGLLPYFQASFSRHTNAFNPNMGCGHDLFGQIMVLKQALSKETGEVVKLDPPPTDMREVFKMKRVRQFWQQYTAWMKEHGWLEAAHFEMVDEPNDESRRELLRVVHTGMREIAPGLTLFSFGPNPNTPGLQGYLDAWGPPLRYFSTHREAFLAEQAQGAEFWTYSCGASYGNDGETQHCPDSGVSDPPLERRIYPWFCYKWDFKGFLLFTMNSWGTWTEEGKNLTTDPAKRWPLNGEKNVTDSDYQLIYPAPDGRPVASMRLENLRDGMEDYEYLYMLEDLLAKLKAAGKAPELVKQGEALLNLEPEIIVHANNFVKDPSLLVARRNAIGDLIVKIRSELQLS